MNHNYSFIFYIIGIWMNITAIFYAFIKNEISDIYYASSFQVEAHIIP